MKIEIEIDDWIYNRIKDFCMINKIDTSEYISEIIIEKYNIDKYGDLNEKIKKVESETNMPLKEKNEIIKGTTQELPIRKDAKTEKEEKSINKIEKPKKKVRVLKSK